MADIKFKEESYKLIGICMEVHRELGMGFKEIIYKDALQLELQQNGIPFQREKQYKIEYKGTILPHKYVADFVVFDKIILEVKAVSGIIDGFVAQTLNYLKASEPELGIIVNFGERSLNYKRVIL